MKQIILSVTALLLSITVTHAQSLVNDKSVRYQQERMVFKQWDQKKFTPTSGFLGLNPWYWLTWGFFYPNYHKTDLRPLSATGPQTQRLGLVGLMNSTENKYKLQSDTIRSTAVSEIANQSGLAAGADPLWLLYYSNELKPVLEHTKASVLSGLSSEVSTKVLSEGLYDWYDSELNRLKERLQGARNADMDRGARIMAYHRYLQEFRHLAGIWAIRIASAEATIGMTAQQQRLRANQVAVPDWSPQADIQIANKVLQHVQ